MDAFASPILDAMIIPPLMMISGFLWCVWKSKNENRAKYAQKFVRLFAKEYGVENAIRLAEIVLKD